MGNMAKSPNGSIDVWIVIFPFKSPVIPKDIKIKELEAGIKAFEASDDRQASQPTGRKGRERRGEKIRVIEFAFLKRS